MQLPSGLLSLSLLLVVVSATPSEVRKVASIQLPALAGKSQGVAAGLDEMYYTLQGNGTVVAVNLTNQRISFKLDLPNCAGFGAFYNKHKTQSVLLVTYQGGSTNLLAFDAQNGTFLYSTESTLSLEPDLGVTPPSWRYFAGQVYWSGLAGFESVAVDTGIVTVNQIPPSLAVSFFPKMDQTCYVTIPFGTGFDQGLESWNFTVNQPVWTLNENIQGGFLGQDERYIYVDNSTALGHGVMLVYNVTSLELVREITHFRGVGFGGLLSPVSNDRHEVTLVWGNEEIRLGAIDLRTGNLTAEHHISGLFHNPMSVENPATKELVVWKDGTIFVYSYPGAQLLLNKTLNATDPNQDKSSPSTASFLPSLDNSPSHLLLGQWEGKAQVVDTTTGKLVFGEQSGSTGSGLFNQPATAYMVKGKRQFVLVHGSEVGVFQY